MNTTFNSGNCKTMTNTSNTQEVSEVSLLDEQSPNYVTFRSRIADENAAGPNAQVGFLEFRDSIVGIMEKWFAVQDEKLSKILNDFDDVRKSVQYLSNKYDELSKETDSILNRITTTEKRCSDLESQTKQIVKLENKIEEMEQHSRQCNIELCNLPERKGENLVAIVESIGVAIKQTIGAKDIVAVHRVRHASDNNRPKNIVVKFTSRIIRDNILSAFRLAKGLHSSKLGIAGEERQIYMNEHLTLRNKMLLRDTKEAAKKYNFRFVWVKNGTVLAREKESSPVLVVRSNEDIVKLAKKK